MPPKEGSAPLIPGEVPQLRQRLVEFLLTRCEPPRAVHSSQGINTAPPPERDAPLMEGRGVQCITIDVMTLLQFCPDLTDLLFFQNPIAALEMIRSEVMNIVRSNEQQQPDTVNARHEVSIRLVHVPRLLLDSPGNNISSTGSGASLSSLKPFVNMLHVVTGTIVRLSAKRVVPAVTKYRCGKCGNSTEIPSNRFHRGDQSKQRCDNSSCKGEALQVISQVWMDYGECRLQQKTEQSTGKLPRSILVTLDDELTTKCNVGQLVEVVGVVKERWRSLYQGATPVIELVMWALNVTPVDASRQQQQEDRSGGTSHQTFRPEAFLQDFPVEDPLRTEKLRVAMVESTCPHLSGVFGPRLGLLLTSVGGAESNNGTHRGNVSATGAPPSSHKVRSTIHMLLVGDPSTGKSQLLRFAAQISPRSTSTTGVTSTSAGLTVAATKEFGEWVLEPGALVLSDGGTCCIDELRTVPAADRTSLHEAMEQQTISVAKAGLVTRLRTECCVIAACNPPFKKKNPYGNVNVEIGVGGPLLSRFDLIFLLWDHAGEATDEIIATHILECCAAPPEAPLSLAHLSTYLTFVRQKYSLSGDGGRSVGGGPLLTDDAADLIGHYYECQRRRGPSPNLCDAVPVTVRLLESLIRLAQAHAKLRLAEECTSMDAAVAILMMERTAFTLKTLLPDLALPRGLAMQHAATVAKERNRQQGNDRLDHAAIEVYTSSRILDEVFLSNSDDCLITQQRVLRCIIDAFSVSSATSGDCCVADGEPIALGAEELEILEAVKTAAPTQMSDGQRKRGRSDSTVASGASPRERCRTEGSPTFSTRKTSGQLTQLSPTSPELAERSVACYSPYAFRATGDVSQRWVERGSDEVRSPAASSAAVAPVAARPQSSKSGTFLDALMRSEDEADTDRHNLSEASTADPPPPQRCATRSASDILAMKFRRWL